MSIENNIHPGWGGFKGLYWLVLIILGVLLLIAWFFNGFKIGWPKITTGLCAPAVTEVVQAAPVVVAPEPVVEVVEPVVVSPYELTAVVDANRNAVLNGYVPSQASMDTVVAAAASNYGANVVNNLQIVDGAPNDWTSTAVNSLGNINPLQNGRIAMRDYDISVSGDAGSDNESANIQSNLTAGIASGYSTNYMITAPAPVVVDVASTCQIDFNNLLATENVNFESAKAIIDPSSYGLLDQMVAIAANCPSAGISVEGHTDSQGAESYNQDLSQRRAEAVVTYLADQGVDVSRLSSIGYGEVMPIGDNDTPEGRAQNRRIEFNVSGN